MTKRLFPKTFQKNKTCSPKNCGKTLGYSQKEEEQEIGYATPNDVLLLDNIPRNKVDFLKITRNQKMVDGDETKQTNIL